MVKKGHKIFIASSGGNMEEEFRALGVHLVNLNIRTKSELNWRIYAASFSVKKYMKQNEIALIHAHTRITQVMGCLLDRFAGIPYVSTCHGFFKKRLSRRMAPCWGRKVIAISEAVAHHLKQDFNVQREQISQINNGIDLEQFAEVDEQTKRNLRKDFSIEAEPLIGIVARLSDVKGQDILIQAMPSIMKEFPQVKLLIVGQGKMESELKHLVEKLNLQKHVLFYPVVNETKRILILLDVFIMPSRQEGLGLSVMEAMACGIPVVASNVGGLPALVQDGKTGLLVQPDHPEALARAILQFLRNPSLASSIAKEAKQLIERLYSAEDMVKKTLAVYERLCVTK